MPRQPQESWCPQPVRDPPLETWKIHPRSSPASSTCGREKLAELLQIQMAMPDRVWTLVLAAGAGRRLSAVTGGTPKQFWSIDGGPSLVESTIARLGPVASPSSTLTVVDESHTRYVERLAEPSSLGRLVIQPADRGTALGVLIGLAPIALSRPDDVVLVTPSDHGVARPDLLQRAILDAAASVRSGRSHVVLFGVTPDVACNDYGWITFGQPDHADRSTRVRPVTGFVEKPAPREAARLLASGAVWNSMVLVARAGGLLNLYRRRHLPELSDLFIHAYRLPPDCRARFLAGIYPTLSVTDFSRDVLTPAEGLAVSIWPTSLGWSDLGTPERLADWLRRHRVQRVFSRLAGNAPHLPSESATTAP
jgi:mannose-1-phosphate guanylyltransferase